MLIFIFFWVEHVKLTITNKFYIFVLPQIRIIGMNYGVGTDSFCNVNNITTSNLASVMDNTVNTKITIILILKVKCFALCIIIK